MGQLNILHNQDEYHNKTTIAKHLNPIACYFSYNVDIFRLLMIKENRSNDLNAFASFLSISIT